MRGNGLTRNMRESTMFGDSREVESVEAQAAGSKLPGKTFFPATRPQLPAIHNVSDIYERVFSLYPARVVLNVGCSHGG